MVNAALTPRKARVERATTETSVVNISVISVQRVDGALKPWDEEEPGEGGGRGWRRKEVVAKKKQMRRARPHEPR